MAVTAKFSTGFTDTYKGKRAVKAAWMVILPTGKVLSGHSLDATRAAATARGNAVACAKWTDGYGATDAYGGKSNYGNARAYALRCAKDRGFASIKAHDAAMQACRDKFWSECKLEIVMI